MSKEKVENEKRIQMRRTISMTTYEMKRRVGAIMPWNSSRRKKTISFRGRQLIFIWSMLAIPIAHFMVFYVYKNFDAILLAFQNVDYAKGGETYWTLDNFKEIGRMLKNKDLILYGKNTLRYWLLGVVMGIPHSIMLTYAFQKKLLGWKVFRVLLYLPNIICGVALAGVFSSAINSNGLFGTFFLEVLHWERVPSWFQEAEYANLALMVYSIFFGFAGNYILYSGAMANIDTEIREAALIDGVCMWQELRYIDIPMMWPTIAMTIIANLSGIFGASGAILLFTSGLKQTWTFDYWIFDQVRSYQAYYVPSALGLCFTLIVFPVVTIVRKKLDNMYATE